jgi:hypothetical protein
VIGRRAFLALAPGAAAAFVAAVRRGEPAPYAALFAWEHPEPRPDVDGSSVLTPEELAGAPHVIDLFDGIRAIPHIADGIRCHCGCAELDGYRSLLSCYEAPGMAQWCEICQGAGRLAVRRAGEGQSLAQIRRAIDARFATPALAVLGARCGATAT